MLEFQAESTIFINNALLAKQAKLSKTFEQLEAVEFIVPELVRQNLKLQQELICIQPQQVLQNLYQLLVKVKDLLNSVKLKKKQ